MVQLGNCIFSNELLTLINLLPASHCILLLMFTVLVVMGTEVQRWEQISQELVLV